MVEPKIKIYVKRQHIIQGSMISFLKLYRSSASAEIIEAAVRRLTFAREPYFEVHFSTGIKSVYTKQPYQQNYNKKDVKILKPLD